MFLANREEISSGEELTPDVMHEFIDKAVVHHREEVFGGKVQKRDLLQDDRTSADSEIESLRETVTKSLLDIQKKSRLPVKAI